MGQNIEIIFSKIITSLAERNSFNSIGRSNIKMFPSLLHEFPVGFFDGAASKGLCGTGLFILLGRDTILKGWLKAGNGSNTLA